MDLVCLSVVLLSIDTNNSHTTIEVCKTNAHLIPEWKFSYCIDEYNSMVHLYI